MKRKLFFIGIALAAIIVTLFIGLRTRQKPTVVNLGWDVVHHIQNHDARSLAAMISPEELNLLSMSRDQAERIIEKCVLPQADAFAKNVKTISPEGNFAGIHRVGDSAHKRFPQLLFARVGKDHFVSLNYLLLSVWAWHRNEMRLAGGSMEDYRAYVKDQFATIKGMGLTKSVDCEKHEAHDIPAEPILDPSSKL